VPAKGEWKILVPLPEGGPPIGPNFERRPIAAQMHAIVQVLELLFEGLSISLPCHAIDSGRSVTREREIAPF
jgi:hypothetical protein